MSTSFKLGSSSITFGDATPGALTGGAGRDFLMAGSAGDTLHGGVGGDALVGGAGHDVFDFSRGDALGAGDDVYGFQSGTDKVALHGVSPRTVSFTTTAAGDTVLHYGTLGGIGPNAETVTFHGAHLAPGDFIFA
jgi:Ca2+-binding RTX toxin-like protein